MQIERLSIELSERCSKGCGFCYNGSNRGGDTAWTVDDLCAFVVDCAAHGVRAFSFGGGEPLEAPELLWPALQAVPGRAFRSMTTNGLLLTPELVARLASAAIDKVHVSIHMPGDRDEVARVIAQVGALAAAGVRSGVNLLVRASQRAQARDAAAQLHAAGIGNERIVFLPMRGRDVPGPVDIAAVARGPVQSTSCLTACGPSPRFVSIGADRSVAWCSYTTARRTLACPTHAALVDATTGLGLVDCADTQGGLVKLTRRASAVT